MLIRADPVVHAEKLRILKVRTATMKVSKGNKVPKLRQGEVFSIYQTVKLRVAVVAISVTLAQNPWCVRNKEIITI